MAISPSLFRILVVGFVALGSTTYGYSSSIISTTLGQPSFLSYFELDTRPNATQLEGTINGLFQAGGLFGSLSCALLALVPLYQSEISPPKIRGFLVGIHGVMLCLGYALASWIGLGFYFVNASGSQWRLPLAIQCLPPLILSCGIYLLPESPRWLIDNDRAEEALKAFESIHAESDTSMAGDHDAMLSDFNLLRALIAHEREQRLSFLDMFKSPSMRKRCLIGFLVLFACQGTATLVINNYGPSLYKSLGFDTVSQLVIQGAWITVCPVGNFINSLIVDRVGRT
ncbi:hypothetical protein F66182_17933, partial [Fusarium sp. NRRL 66182]